MNEPASAAQHPSPVNSAGCLILAFAGAALAWGAAGFALLVFEDLRAALNLPWLAILPLPAMLFAFEINVLLAAALFMAHPEGCPELRWRSALWLGFLYVQGVNAAAGLGLSLALQTGAAWSASSLYGILWAPVPLLFLAALLPGYRRTLQPLAGLCWRPCCALPWRNWCEASRTPYWLAVFPIGFVQTCARDCRAGFRPPMDFRPPMERPSHSPSAL